MYTVLKGEKVHNSYTFMLITFFVGIFLQFFQRIRNQHQFCVFCYPFRNNWKKLVFWSYKHFLQFLKPNAHKTAQKTKIFFSNVNQNKLYNPILVSDQQVVKIVSPLCTKNVHVIMHRSREKLNTFMN